MSLTERDFRIIRTLKQHRFLSTNHLERWHFFDHASPLSAARSTRRVLAKLKRLGIITALPRTLGGVNGGSSQHVWHLTPVGERLGSSRTERRVREPSTAFLKHELGVAGIHLSLIEAERAGKLKVIDFTTEPRCWRPFLGAGGSLVMLKPDFFAIVAAHADWETLVFGEYDRSTESLKTIAKKKADAYEAYWRTGIEDKRSGGFPQVLWIAPDNERITRIRRELGRTAGVTMALHAFTTPDDIVKKLTAENREADHA
ncbi:replication-relaxation family protein [Microbacterium sp. S1037]|uniref:replication-relaxation family protein n=1 Tax=Microbacterium sp. S1037 TaxID=3398227 RepID=UPI003AAC7719